MKISERLDAIRQSDPATWIRPLQGHEIPAAKEGTLDLTFAIKDNIDLAGIPTTAGCPDYAYTPSEHAFVVQALINAGALPLGKTNMDQFATGLVGTRSPYGIARHPIDPAYIPGGSSSGSAVAVASGQVDFALGTDTAGSGRVPAAFNGLIGVKPTRGLLSCTGVVPACRSLDCVSIFAREFEVAQRVLEVACAFDPADGYARPFQTPERPLPSRPRIGVPRNDQLTFFGNQAYADCFEEAKRAFGDHAEVIEIDASPFFDAAKLLYGGPWVAERSAVLKTFFSEQPESMHPVTRKIIGGGFNYSSVETFEAMYALADLRRQADAAWESIDILLTPTAGTHYTIAEVEADPVQTNSNLGTYTNFMNLLDLCALAVPAGTTPAGMPFGVTLAAPAFQDFELLQFASRCAGVELPPVANTDSVRVAVCGAHLQGFPLNHQLLERGGTLVAKTRSAPRYRFYELAGSQPSKPGMVRSEDGAAIEVEVWELPTHHFGSFVAAIPYPLGIGSIELEDGTWVQGFSCDPSGLEGARDITSFGSWRAFQEIHAIIL